MKALLLGGLMGLSVSAVPGGMTLASPDVPKLASAMEAHALDSASITALYSR